MVISEIENTSKLRQQLLDTIHHEAQNADAISGDNGPFLSAPAIEYLEKAIELAEKYQRSTTDDKEDILGELKDKGKELSDSEKLEISQILGLKAMAINGVNNYVNAKSLEPPKEQFKNLFRSVVGQENITQAEEDLDALLEIKERMIVSLVQTMHPVVFHTAQAREWEAFATQWLETQSDTSLSEGEFNDKRMSEFTHMLHNALTAIKEDGAELTPFKKVTVAMEAAAEKRNWDNIKRAVPEVTKAWNEAVQEMLAENEVPDELRDRFQQLLTDDLEVERRTWIVSDADGRRDATSFALIRKFQDGIEDSHYTGEILDLRQNSGIFRHIANSLIQVHYWKNDDGTLDDGFDDHCKKFVSEASVSDYSATSNVYLQLPEEDRTAFLRSVIEKNYEMVPELIKQDVQTFMNVFPEVYRDFLEDKGIEGDPLPQELDPKTRKELNDLAAEYGFQFSKSGRSYYYRGDPEIFGSTGNADITDVTRDFFDGVLVTGQEIEELIPAGSPHERLLLDNIKRLIVIKEGIEQFPEDRVSERHQIANFSEAADFYGLMLLLQQTDLISIENGKVVNADKMGIMPLLETVEDLQNAKQIFEQLLEDPLALSYFQERGVAEFMLGFSDGGKDAGSFSAQWEIYKASRELQQVFEAKGIKVRFFQGRGRGRDRGGPIEQGAAMHLLSEDLAETATVDTTIQGDLPEHMASSPAFAQDTLTSLRIGTITAALDAREIHTRTDQDNERIASYESAIEWIAERQRRVFVELVRDNEHAADFLFTYPNSDTISSRSTTRPSMGSDLPRYGDIRAITVEYGFGMAGLPAHMIGLRQAMDDFIESGQSVLNEAGERVEGMEALGELYRNHKFFRLMTELGEDRMQQYDVVTAEMYAEIGDRGMKLFRSEFVEHARQHLSRLTDNLQAIIRHGTTHQEREEARGTTEEQSTNPEMKSLGVIAHGLMGAILEEHKDKTLDAEESPVALKTVKHLNFVHAQEFKQSTHKRNVRQEVLAGGIAA